MATEQLVEVQKHLERRLASLLEEFEHWYGRPVTMATLCIVAASAVEFEQRRGLDALAASNSAFSLVYDGTVGPPRWQPTPMVTTSNERLGSGVPVRK